MGTKFKNKIVKYLEFIMAMLMAVMAILVFMNVVMRYVFHSGIHGSDEISRLGFIWLSFLGAVAVMITGGHLGVDMLLRKLPKKSKIICGLVGRALMAWVLGMLVLGSWEQILLNYGIVNMGAVPYPIWWNYAAGLFAGVGGLLWVLFDTLRLLKGDIRCLEFNAVEDEGDLVAVLSKVQETDVQDLNNSQKDK